MMPLLLQLYAVLAGILTAVQAVLPVEVRQQEFVVTATGQRFVLLGVDYQPGGQAGYKPQSGEDALTNGQVCLRDAIVMQSLGVNVIRVYNVSPDLNHDECASIFNSAGIYLLMDVNSPFPNESINRADPASSYNAGYLERTFRIVEAFKGYPNTLGFFAANEVMNDIPTSQDNPPYIRAVQRDLKQYIANHADRTIPVGYSAADVREILQDTWEYLQCAIDGNSDDQSRTDFFGLNSYSWCGGDATFETSEYNVLVETFSSTTVPVFFSEYGCNEVQPRVFDEVQALYGTRMTTLSGGLVYEYSQEEANYGLVSINDNQTISLREDFMNLEGQYNRLDIGLIESANSTATSLETPRCSEDLIQSSDFSKNFTIPEQPDDIAELIRNGVSDPNRGRLVDVTERALPFAVYGVDGQEVGGLELQILSDDETNTPNGGNTGDSNESANEDEEDAAARLVIAPAALLCMIVATLFVL